MNCAGVRFSGSYDREEFKEDFDKVQNFVGATGILNSASKIKFLQNLGVFASDKATSGPDVGDKFSRGLDDLFNSTRKRLEQCDDRKDKDAYFNSRHLSSPLILDLDFNGIHLNSLGESEVFFDLDSNGSAEKTSWISSADGFLALDKNNNGIIDDSNELFGSEYQDGFTILSLYDDNNDGVINAYDPVFDNLKLWVDSNVDGYTDFGELFNISDYYVSEINLSADVVNEYVNGNLISHNSSFKFSNGTESLVSDVWFLNDKFFTQYYINKSEEEGFLLGVPDDAFKLPLLKGYGNVKDLIVAIKDDSLVYEKAKDVLNLDVNNYHFFDDKFNEFILRWSGASSLGLAVVQEFFGVSGEKVSEGKRATYALSTIVSRWHERYAVKFLVGSLVKDLSSNLIYDPFYHKVTGFFNGFLEDLKGNYDENDEYYWAKVVPIVDRIYNHLMESDHFVIDVPDNFNVYSDALNNLIISTDYDLSLDEIRKINFVESFEGDDLINIDDKGYHVITKSGDDQVTSGAGNDFIDGGDGDDRLVSGRGNDVVYGGKGNDIIEIGLGNDIAYGDNGNDIIVSRGGLDEISGGEGDDLLKILRFDEPGASFSKHVSLAGSVFLGGKGNDRLEGWTGADIYIFNVGDGYDVINDYDRGYYDGSSAVSYMKNDFIHFGEGIDYDDLEFKKFGDDLVVLIKNDYSDRIIVENHFENFYRIERFKLFDGSEYDMPSIIINGTISNDLISVQSDSVNVLIGGDGDDILRLDISGGEYAGRTSSNYLSRFEGGHGNDRMEGFTSADTYVFNRGDGHDTILDTDYGASHRSGPKRNRYTANSSFGSTDRVIFGYGIERDDLLLSQEGKDLVISINDGSAELSDSVRIEGWFEANRYRIERFEFENGDVLSTSDINALWVSQDQTEGDDIITGAVDMVLSINGLGGDDKITTGNLSDIIDGGQGNDVIEAGNGDNQILGGSGNDVITSGSGADTIEAGLGNDSVYVSGGDNFINGGSGDDTIVTGAGFDEIHGGEGSDYLHGGAGNSLVFGNEGNDQLVALSSFDNTLIGGDGDDILRLDISGGEYAGRTSSNYLSRFEGGHGNDRMEGFTSADTYVFNRGDGHDTILDTDYGASHRSGPKRNRYTANSSFGSTDRVIFGYGIERDDLLLSQEGKDLVISINDGSAELSDSVRIEGWFEANRYRIERFEFENGDVLSTSDINALWVSQDQTEGDDIITGAVDMVLSINGLGGDDKITTGNLSDIIDGGQGNDVIEAGNGDNQILGGSGNDVITSGSGADTIEAGLGNDSVYVSGGDNFINGGSGDDTIVTGAGFDEIHGGEGSDYLHGGAGNSLVFGNEGNDQLVALSSFDNTLIGGDGDDILRLDISGGEYAGRTSSNYLSRFEGGHGNDRMEGFTSADTYVFNRGDGHDTILDTDYGASHRSGPKRNRYTANSSFGSTDRVIFGYGIERDDLLLSQEGKDLVISINDGSAELSDSVRIEGWFEANRYRIERFEFENGDVLSTSDINALWVSQDQTEGDDIITGAVDMVLSINGLGGDDKITTGNLSDIIDGGQGNDVIEAGNGDNQILGGSGNDVITSGSGADTIEAGLGNDSVYVSGGDNFINGGSGDDTIVTGAGFDEIHGGEGSDYLHGGAGNSLVFGNEGNDQLVALSSFDNTLIGGDGDDILRLDISGGEYAGRTSSNYLSRFEGGHGNDRMEGFTSADTYVFNRGDGHDTILDTDYGASHRSGPKRNRYTANSSFGSTDRVIFGYGIERDDLLLSQEGKDLVISINDGSAELSDSVRIEGWFEANRYRIERFEFENGDVLSTSDINALWVSQDQTEGDDIITGAVDMVLSINGLGGDDKITTGNLSDIIDGGQGNDVIEAGNGDNQILGGSGNDVITSGSGADTIEAGLGNDSVYVSGGDNFINGGSGDDTIVTGAGFDEIHGGEGSDMLNVGSGNDAAVGGAGADTLVASYSGSNDLSGNEGDDVIRIERANTYNSYNANTASGASNTLTGGTGNDRLEGWTGSDTYVFNRGDGHDAINDYDRGYHSRSQRSFYRTDTLLLGDGITSDNLWFARAGDSLVIDIENATDQVTIENWYSDTAYQIESISTSESTLDHTKVDALVQAMAAFDAPTSAGEEIPQDVKDQLQPVLATSWQPVG